MLFNKFQELRRDLCGAAGTLEPLPGFCINFLRLQNPAVPLLGGKKIMGLRHGNTLDFGNVQPLKFSAAGITVFGFVLDFRLFLPALGLAPPLPPVLFDFVGIFLPSILEKSVV